jgi:hypothetical protein
MIFFLDIEEDEHSKVLSYSDYCFWDFGEYLKIFESYDDCEGILEYEFVEYEVFKEYKYLIFLWILGFLEGLRVFCWFLKVF